jgi:hypothetical protein
MAAGLEWVGADAQCVIFAYLTPLDVAAARSGSRQLHRALDWRGAPIVWERAALHVSIPRLLADVPTVRAAACFAEIYRSKLQDETDEQLGCILAAACSRGWLEKAQWAVARYPRCIPRPGLWEHQENVATSLLHGACKGGHLPTAQWVAAIFNMRATLWADIYACGAALHIACSEGHLAVAQWLVAHFAIDQEFLTKINTLSDLFFVAQANGHHAVHQWLTAHYGSH